MNLTLRGHDDRYAVEQLLMALFPANSPVEAVSALSRGKVYMTASTVLTFGGRTVRSVRRMKAGQESVRLRRRLLQQSLYLAALQLLETAPAWGALAGVRPTKIPPKHLLQGGTGEPADRPMKVDS